MRKFFGGGIARIPEYGRYNNIFSTNLGGGFAIVQSTSYQSDTKSNMFMKVHV